MPLPWSETMTSTCGRVSATVAFAVAFAVAFVLTVAGATRNWHQSNWHHFLESGTGACSIGAAT